MPDYLTKRNGFWQFVRRVPLDFAKLDPRGVIKHSTKVPVAKDRCGVKAGKRAELLNRELEAYWRGLSEGKAQEAEKRYAEARRRARLGFNYAETAELSNRPTLRKKQPTNKQIAVQPIAHTLVKNLVGLAKAFAKTANIKITTVGTNSTKTASFYTDLESGKTSCTLRKYDLLTMWFSEKWPEGHVMPILEDPQHYRGAI